MTETYVKYFTHLQGRPKAEQALPILQRVASLVKPIMRKHGWVLSTLSEFFPESPNLIGLNVNGGEKILLRLRPAWAPDTFYDIEDVVHTMLHELTHNVHGAHDEKFYKFLSGLEDEHAALKRSGYAGEGFFSPGQRLGTGASHNLPPHIARQRALEAAENRRKMSTLMSGGRRLGGAPVHRNLTPRELAAEAAERRARDEKACGSGALAQREAEKAAKESIENDAIDLTGNDPDPESDVILLDRPSSVSGPSKVSVSQQKRKASVTSLKRDDTSSHTSAGPASKNDDWGCPACTYLNQPTAFRCAMCDTHRPQSGSSEGWTCTVCGEAEMSHHLWTCRFCGSVKASS
ncbi:WLM-domain-containing protein [Neolentinus lepideus HHB14362 ss-1]|uniref:WLM-domain-containing protein n=1 Tax=Neolentinus lepideus HHB14362 ss-1 TaxID=1314782 RepID=A0A165WB57_9AGAM|nr:WLM-domain-containing protein [Neolentinus lepideus HHB14362 ss-1]